MKPTDIKDPEYFHKVVDCQHACPAHTPVPQYIRLIAEEKYTEAYMINWDSNVFPGVLGRTCDRPCEPACRRVRVEEEPVAICRLKRVAADNKGFGFITPESGEKDVFVHSSSLNGAHIRENDKVEFEVESGPKGLNATNVRVI